MPDWLDDALRQSAYFMPHGHCYLWIPSILWTHVVSDLLIGVAYVGISLILWGLVRRLRLPFSPVFVAFGLFIGLCGGTHFMEIWNVWRPDYVAAGLLKAATAIASVATLVGLVYVKPQVEAVVQAARLSEERRARLEVAHSELESLFNRVRELDEQRTRFFANVSHELRTPLTLILAPAERLRAGPLDPAQRRDVDTVHANATVLLRQVNDLLDAARLEAGQARLHPVALDVAPWLRRVVGQFDGVAEQRGIALAVHAADVCAAAVDADKLERVLVNLLSNALRHTPAGGRIDVALECDADTLAFVVADTGPGIPAAQREAVFERFHQVEGDDARVGGTGLGLSIVREFVALHAGRVELDEAPGGGARFRVAVPRHARVDRPAAHVDALAPVAAAAARQELSPAPAQPAAEPVPVDDDTPRPRILVVEDNAEMRDFLAATLATRYRVDTAPDGEAALAAIRASAPDLVITDLMMPRMPGDELVRALRADAVFATVPVLMLTARADDDLRVAMLREGVQDYLTKPFGTAELLARAGNLVQAKRAGDVLRGELATLSTDLADLALRVSAKNRQLQAALHAAEVARRQAEQASRAKGYFLGMVSHELRSPLATIGLNLQLLSRDPAFPDAMRTRLERVQRAMQQMSALVENLLEHTRLESGRVEVRASDVDLGPLLRELLDDQRAAVADGVHARLDVATPPPTVRTDPDLLRLVVGNLVSNALKFTREGEVVLRAFADAHGAVIEVRDTGIGIDAADLERIFEPFEQVEPLRGKSLPGVGLGLAMVRQVTAALGGHVTVESTPGAGTTFRVHLPADAPG